MSIMTLPALRVRQGKMVIYTVSLKVRQLISDKFYSVEKLDPNESKLGFQRMLDEGRTKKLANYIVAGQDRQDVLLPTSIFLATDKDIPFDESSNTIQIDTHAICPLSVVDGQHRLEGLKLAASKDERVLDFEVSVNIAVRLEEVVQMCHFLLVNSTQRVVSTAVEQAIRDRLHEKYKTSNMPTLPTGIDKLITVGDESKAYRYVKYLNETDGSPWKGHIQMANEKIKGHFIKQASFVKAIKKDVLSANNPLARYDYDEGKDILLNYWKAIANILDDGVKPSVAYKYNGVHLFSRFSTPLFMKIEAHPDLRFTVEAIQELLQKCFAGLQGEHSGVGSPDYWHIGSIASKHNQGAMNPIYKEMVASLHAKNEGSL